MLYKCDRFDVRERCGEEEVGVKEGVGSVRCVYPASEESLRDDVKQVQVRERSEDVNR